VSFEKPSRGCAEHAPVEKSAVRIEHVEIQIAEAIPRYL
jgi:hypothetical protein